MNSLLISNVNIVNEGSIINANLLTRNDRIAAISENVTNLPADNIIDATGLYLIPGIIDDQVHFREPGLIHKGEIYTESRAAAAGGVTSFMEMPNTNPQTISQTELENKFALAAKKSLVNYSFYIGATNDNLDELLKTDPKKVCGIKVFMGSSTGNMLVDNKETLKSIFKESPLLIATHCEDEETIKSNSERFKATYGEKLPFKFHPQIRNTEACYKSSSLAVELAQKYGARLHILHLSTEKELSLFNKGNIKEKNITAEACIHHLWFNDQDYDKYGSRIKWNPAIKSEKDRMALIKAVVEDKIDVIATDHAPHTLEEKSHSYFRAPSGGPLVQHSLIVMLEMYHKGLFQLEHIVKKMCHDPAELFRVKDRGYLREGYKADMVLVDLNNPQTIEKTKIFYKCGWSPFEGQEFKSRIIKTIVNGKIVFDNGKIIESDASEPLEFNR